jgi:hypothetical protein
MVEPGTLATCNTEKPFEAAKVDRTRVQRIPSRSRPSAQSKTGYICADQTAIFTFRLRHGGGPYIPVLPVIQHHGCSERGVCRQGAGCATPVTPVRDSGLKRSGALSLRESQTIVQAAASADRASGRCFKLTEPSGSNTNSYSLLQGPHSQKCSSLVSPRLP